jgi:NAD(P)-dependent dehydrogenase (short-subunit alcohol dehydrogenase family)
MPWTTADLPDLSGRTAVITGANSGLGYETALALAGCGAAVTMAVRDVTKGEQAAAEIRRTVPGATVEVGPLDLASLASVREFAARWSQAHEDGLDLLINNAGVMAIPHRLTADGFEMQIGTNHLGHFALTGLLLPALVARHRSRIVTVSSFAHRMGRLDLNDLMGQRRYRSWGAYGQSKLANLLFSGELQRRLDRAHLSVKAMAAHPGYAHTNLQSASARMQGKSFQARMADRTNDLLAQSAAMGALPTLFAATAPGLPGDSFVGPNGFMELRGYPQLVGRSARAADLADAAALWAASEQLTGVVYPFD